MSPIAELVVADAAHVRALSGLYMQLADAGRMSEADAVWYGMVCLSGQLRERAGLLISMGASA